MKYLNFASHPRPVFAATMVLGLFFTACSTPAEPQPGASPTDDAVTVTPQPAPGNSSAPADPRGEPDQTRPVGSFTTESYESADWPNAASTTQGIYPTEIRAARHDGFERIVIEHAGTGTPAMLVEYVDNPVAPGSGLPIELDQDAILEVIWSGMASTDDIDDSQLMTVGEPITDFNTSAIQSALVNAPWEATSSYFIGLDEERPYAVAIYDDPVRLVIDIQTTD